MSNLAAAIFFIGWSALIVFILIHIPIWVYVSFIGAGLLHLIYRSIE